MTSQVVTRLGALIDVERTSFIVIHDSWRGYNMGTPFVASYRLGRGARGGFRGAGRFSRAGTVEHTLDIAIPSAAASRFLREVAAAPTTPGLDVEAIGCWADGATELRTDDYPRVEIALHVDGADVAEGGIALLFTESQSEPPGPWGACALGQLWTLPGRELGVALAALRRPLRRAVLQRMIMR
jgi:hypothetical protein